MIGTTQDPGYPRGRGPGLGGRDQNKALSRLFAVMILGCRFSFSAEFAACWRPVGGQHGTQQGLKENQREYQLYDVE